VQLLYLGKLSIAKYHEFSLKLLIFPKLKYLDIKCKAVTILFYLLIIQLPVKSKTITFIADDKIVYQRVRREMRLASDNSSARRHLKHSSWRLRWIILCTLERGMAVSCEISRVDRCWLSMRSSTFSVFWLLRAERGLLLPGCRASVGLPVLRILFSSDRCFQVSNQVFNSLRAPYPLWQRYF